MTDETRDPRSLPHDLGKLPDELEATYDEIDPLPASGYPGESHTYRGITGEDSTPVEAVVEALPDEDEEPTPPLAVPPPVRPAMQPPPPKRHQPRQRLAHPMIWLLLIASLTVNIAGVFVGQAYLDTEVELRIRERQTPQQLKNDRDELTRQAIQAVTYCQNEAALHLSSERIEELATRGQQLVNMDEVVFHLLEIENALEFAANGDYSSGAHEARLFIRKVRSELQKMQRLLDSPAYLDSRNEEDLTLFDLKMGEFKSLITTANP